LKKTVSILLFSIFLLSQIGHQLVFKLAQWDAKNIIREQISTQSLKGIVEKIPYNNNIHWEEKDKEFELFGQMYDVIKKEISGTTTFYYCVNDNKEQDLLSIYNNWIQTHHSENDNKSNCKIQLKFITIECDIPASKANTYTTYQSSTFRKYLNTGLQTVYLKEKGIPPQLIAS
jgi:hypothetical protein